MALTQIPKPWTPLERIVPPTYVYPLATGSRPPLYDVNAIPTVTPRLEGTIAGQSFVFLTPPPEPLQTRRTYRVTTTNRPRSARLNPAQASLPPFGVIPMQPDRALPVEWTAAVRFRQEAPLQVQQGVSVQTRYDGSLLLTPYVRPLERRLVLDYKPPLLGGGVIVQTDTFSAFPNPVAYLSTFTPKVLARQIRGPAIPAPNPPTLPIAPSDQWWLTIERVRRAPIVLPRLDGATTQATFVFPITQPDRQAWYVPRPAQFTAPLPRIDGAAVQQTSLFGHILPDASWYALRATPELITQLTGAFTPPAPPQSYVFVPNQPDRRGWYVPRWPSEQVPVAAIWPHFGASAQAPQLYEFLLTPPDSRHWLNLWQARTPASVDGWLHLGVSTTVVVVVPVGLTAVQALTRRSVTATTFRWIRIPGVRQVRDEP